MQLTTGNTLNGKAGTGTAVTYTITGDRKTTTDSYEVLGQGQLPTSTGALLTTSPVAASTQLIISEILLTNTTASPVTGIVLYVNGTAAANQIVTMSLVANGSATYRNGQWQTYDSSGSSLGGSGIVDTTTNQTVGGTKTFSSKPVLSAGAKLTGVASPTYDQGALVYDTDNESLTFYNNDSATSLQVGQEEWVRVINKTGSTIANGQAVYINGADATSGLPTIALAKGDAATTIIGLGLTTQSIANNAKGMVTTMGVVHGLDTSAFTAGATVFVSATTAGALTSTAPTAPNYRYRIGIVVISDATVGSIHVTPSTAALGNGTANQVFGINNAGTAQEVKTIQGTASDVTVTNGANTITIATTGKVATTRAINTTAPLTGGGDLSADRTLAISAATTSAAGSMSANDKKKEDNMYYDVTANSIATLVGDDLTDNTSAWNTLFAALPVGATVYFPSGTYRTSTGFNISADKHLRIQGAGKYTTYIKTTSATGNGFQINGSYWYNTFEDMGFTHLLTGSSVTGGAGININPGASGSAVGTNIYRCSFVGLFVGVRAVGSQAANLSVWDSLDISAASTAANAVPNARGILWNGDTINMVISNSTVNMIFPAPAFSQFPATGAVGMEIQQSGAIQLVGGEFIGGQNTLLLNANQGGTTSVAAVYATNCFFDQSNGSTVKITGANIVNRVKFVQCGITTGNTGVTGAIAVEIASSGTGSAGGPTAAADGIDFFDCDLYPNGVTGTVNGFQITGAQGVAINSCRISGFTNGITVTPAASNGYTKIQIGNNKMGATNNFTTFNTVGLNLNAGSFQYGVVKVSDNDFTGSTTPMVDNSTVTSAAIKSINSNLGMANNGSSLVTTPATIAATETVVHSIPLPANSMLVGTTFRITAAGIITATAPTLTGRVRIGTTGTTADAAVVATPAVAVATGTGWTTEMYVTIRTIGSGGTWMGQGLVQGTAPGKSTNTATQAINTTVANFLTLTLQGGGTTPVITVVSAYSQVVNQ